MPRYDANLTKIKLCPECPPDWRQVPMLRAYWDCQVDILLQAFPRLYGQRLAAVILRRAQESLGH